MFPNKYITSSCMSCATSDIIVEIFFIECGQYLVEADRVLVLKHQRTIC